MKNAIFHQQNHQHFDAEFLMDVGCEKNTFVLKLSGNVKNYILNNMKKYIIQTFQQSQQCKRQCTLDSSHLYVKVKLVVTYKTTQKKFFFRFQHSVFAYFYATRFFSSKLHMENNAFLQCIFYSVFTFNGTYINFFIFHSNRFLSFSLSMAKLCMKPVEDEIGKLVTKFYRLLI